MAMKDNNSKNKFIELRASGKSFKAISEELQVSKPTLIKWSREFQLEIQNMRALQLDEIREKYLLTQEHKIKTYYDFLIKIESELESRTLSDIPTEKLLALYNDIKIKLRDLSRVEFSENVGFQVPSMDTIERWPA